MCHITLTWRAFLIHKHVGHQAHLAPSHETCLEDVMNVILAEEDHEARLGSSP